MHIPSISYLLFSREPAQEAILKLALKVYHAQPNAPMLFSNHTYRTAHKFREKNIFAFFVGQTISTKKKSMKIQFHACATC